MNIFVLDENPVVAANLMHDKHIVKMVLETAQLMSTAVIALGGRADGLYKPTHQAHPCSLWLLEAPANFCWLYEHGRALDAEFRHRFSGRSHASYSVIKQAYESYPRILQEYRAHTPFAQAMPDEYKVPGDAVSAYRNYYLGRKVEQSKWTRRPVPAFVLEHQEMSKKHHAKAPEVAEATAPVVEAAAEPKKSPIGARGPKGVPLDAKITILVAANPKRPAGKSYGRFELYRDGMSVNDALTAGVLTADLIYDTAHNFIAIEGYTSPKPFTPKERPVKEPKAAKAPRKAKAKTAEQEAAEHDVALAVQEETID